MRRDQRGGLPLSRGAGDRRARCSSAATRTRSRSRPSARSSRSSRAHGVDVVIDADDGPTPTPVISHAILAYNRGGGPDRGGRDRRHAVAQPARRRRLQVQPAARRAGRHRRHGLDRARGQRAARGGAGRRHARALRGGRGRAARLRLRLRRRPAVGDRHRRDPRRRAEARASTRSAARASRYWQAIAERHGLDLDDRQRPARPDLPLRPARLGRQDPHGLLLAVRDGAAARPGGPLRRRLRQRPRRRPPRHRHAGRRAAEPQPPPRRRASPTCSAASREWGEDVGDRQDARLEQHHRPRSRATSAAGSSRCPSASSGSSRACSTGTLGFGGEESAGASFLRRDGTAWSDRQGRADPVPAGRGDDGARRARIPASVYARADRALRRAAYQRIDVAATPEEKAVLKKLSPDQVTSDELAGEPIRAVLTKAPGNGARDRRPEGVGRARLVRRPAVRDRGRLQGLRRELWTARSTWSASSRRPSRS